MPDTNPHFREARTPVFDTLPLSALQTLLTTDKANRKEASKVIFARNDSEALQLQETLMKNWLGSPVLPPIDLATLNTALYRKDSSISYKILCLLLMQQLNNEKPEIDRTELMDYVSQGLSSKDATRIIAAAHTLPIAIAVAKASKVNPNEEASVDDWRETLRTWVLSIDELYKLLPEVRLNELNIGEGQQSLKNLNYITGETMSAVGEAQLALFENSRHKHIMFITFPICLETAMLPSSWWPKQAQILISALKQARNLPELLGIIDQSLTQPPRVNFSDKKVLQVIQNAFNSVESKTSQKIRVDLTASVIKNYHLPAIMPVLQDSLQHKDEIDKLINRVILRSFATKEPATLRILNAVIPKLTAKQLETLFVEIDAAKSPQQFLVEHLVNLFTNAQLTPEQSDKLVTILSTEISEFRGIFLSNFFKILPTVLLNASPEQKSQLLAQTKAICLNPNFWNTAQDSPNYMQLLSPEDFKEVYTTISNQFPEINKITPVLREILISPQLTQEQFILLMDNIDTHFWDEDIWEEDDLSRGAREVLSSILQSSYLSPAQYSRWFNIVDDLLQKRIFQLVQVLPAALNSPYLTPSKFETIIDLFLKLDLSELEFNSIPFGETLSTLFTSPQLTEDQFTSLVDKLLKAKLNSSTLLNVIPTILQTAKSKATTISTHDKTNELWREIINGLRIFGNLQDLKAFLYNPLIIERLINNTQDLQSLVKTLNSSPSSFLELQNFLCYLVISKKISANQLATVIADEPLFKLAPTFLKLYNQQQSGKENTNRHSMFGSSQPSNKQKASEEEDIDENAPPRKRARGLGLE